MEALPSARSALSEPSTRPGPSSLPPAGAGAASSAVVRLTRLQALSADLADALTVEQSARAVMRTLANLPQVSRAGLALTAGGGRELRFISLQEHEPPPPGRLAWCSLDASADLPLVHAAVTGQPLWFDTLDELAQRYPDLAVHQAGYGTRAFVTLPLRARAELVGALMLCYHEERPFDDAERAFLHALAEQAAHALRRAAAYEQQRTTAELLQRGLLPDTLPHLSGLALAARYEPAAGGAEVGGDWFDVLEIDRGPQAGAVLVVMGDVMGRGLGAAMVMGDIRAALRAYALLDPTPHVLLERLDALVARLGSPEQLVTVLVGLVAADRSRVTVATAGHPPPVLKIRGRAATVVPLPNEPPLGLGQEHRSQATLGLSLGSWLVLCTDGVVESPERPAEDGLRLLARALDALAPSVPREACGVLLDALGDGGHEEVDDDRAILVLASTVGHDARDASTALVPDPRAAAQARRWLRGVLAGWGVEQRAVDDALVCLSEVVTNAVIHTGSAPRVRASLAGSLLEVTVADSGRAGHARPVESDPDAVGGRGLVVVSALATAWSSERTSQGTTVWFEIDVSAAAA